MSSKLGVGFVGAGFITNFHIRSWQGVRDADIVGIVGRTESRAVAAADNCRKYRVGDPKVYRSLTEIVEDPPVDVLWICAPNYLRVPMMQEIVETVTSGRGKLIGVACEKPLARNVAEAKQMLQLAQEADLLHGYLENQVFAPSLTRGKENELAKMAQLDHSLQEVARQLVADDKSGRDKIIKLVELLPFMSREQAVDLKKYRDQLAALRQKITDNNLINKRFACDTLGYINDAIALICNEITNEPAYHPGRGLAGSSPAPALVSREV